MKDLKKNFLAFFKVSWPFLFILGVVFLFFWKVFLKGMVPIPGDIVLGVYYPWLDYKWDYAAGVPVKNPILSDVVSFTYPMQMLGIDLIKVGEAPLWNPYIFGGTPLLANFQSAPFSPTNFIYFFLDKLNGWSFQIIFQHILALLFTYLLLRSWKLSKIASVLGGLIFTFSGFNVIWSQWNGHVLAASFIPLILFFEDRFLLTGKVWYGAGISIFLFLLFLSGYPQIALYLLVAVLALWIFRIRKDKNWLKRSVFMATFFLLGLGLSAVQLLPGGELLKYSQRGVELHPYEWAFLPWGKIVTLIAPDFYGNHATANYWGPQDYTSNTGFVGVFAFVLASVSFFFLKQKKEIFFAFVVLLLSLILAFPTPVSIFLWRSGLFGLNAASAHRSLVLFNLSIAILAAFGLDRLGELPKEKFKSLFVFVIPAIILISFGVWALGLRGQLIHNIPASSVALRNLVLPTVFLCLAFLTVALKPNARFLLLMLTVFELFRFGWKFTPFSEKSLVFPETPVLEFLKSQKGPYRVVADKVIPINLLMNYRIETLEGYDAVYPKTVSEFIAKINGSYGATNSIRRYGIIDNYNSELLDLANVKYLVIKKEETDSYLKNKKFKIAFEDKSVVILENLKVLPRAFMLGDERFLNSKASFLEYSNQKARIAVEAKKKGDLFISDSYYPGWKAFLDGKEIGINKAESIFRAIEVPEGIHEVELIYRPESFYNGLKITIISLALLTLFLVLGKRYTLERK